MKRILILLMIALTPFLMKGQVVYDVINQGNYFDLKIGSFTESFSKGLYETYTNGDKFGLKRSGDGTWIAYPQDFSLWGADGVQFATVDSLNDAVALVIASTEVTYTTDTLFVGSDTVVIPSPSLMDSIYNANESEWLSNGDTIALISGGGGLAIWDTTATAIVPDSGAVDYTQRDFVIGSDQLDDDGNTSHDKRLLFDKSKGYFASGTMTTTYWDDANRGNNSASFGNLTRATGDISFAQGQNTLVSGDYSVGMGRDHVVSAPYAMAVNRDHDVSGTYGFCAGINNDAVSFGEFSIGLYNTVYTANSAGVFNANDRLFNIGNGTGTGTRSDALTVLKGGEVGIGIDSFETYHDSTYLFEVEGSARIGGNTKTDTLTVICPKTGWAQYADTVVTQSSPQSILTTDTAVVTNNKHTNIETYLPCGIDSIYGGGKMVGELGASYMVRVQFDARTSVVSDYFNLIFDIGANDNNPIIISDRTMTFPKGQNTWHTYTATSLLYSLSTFVSNGMKIKAVAGGGTLDLANVQYVISKVTHAE